MAQISFLPNKAYPSIPTVGADLEAHSRAIEAIKEALQVHERRSKDVLNSFVRVQELADLGLIQLDGAVVEDVTPVEEPTTHHHNSTYIRLDGTSDPTTGEIFFGVGIDVTGGITADSINGVLATDRVHMDHLMTGICLGDPVVAVASNGSTITLSLSNAESGDLRFFFTSGVTIVNTDPTPVTIALTPGTDDENPALNYVYILESTGALAVSTSDWPAAEHAPIATVLCQTAASAQTDGLYKVHAWTDHTHSDDTGHIGDINYWIRTQPATWRSGALAVVTDGVGVFDLSVSSGEILQLHPHTWPGFDTSTGSEVMVINDSVTAYVRGGDLTGITLDASGGALLNRYFNIIVWGVISEDTGDCQLMINLPTGSYVLSSDAQTDVDGKSVYDIPSDYTGAGFLIARLTMQLTTSSTYTEVLNTDLRGLFPSTGAGGAGGGGGVTELIELTDVDTAASTAAFFLATPNASTGQYSGRAIIAADLPDLSATYSPAAHDHSGVYEPYDLAIVKSDETETIASIWNFTGIPTFNSLAVPHYVTATYTSADIDVQSSEPPTPAKGDIWFDTTVTGALLNIIEDTTPQLGADLDGNGFGIDNIDRLEVRNAADDAWLTITVDAGQQAIYDLTPENANWHEFRGDTGVYFRGSGYAEFGAIVNTGTANYGEFIIYQEVDGTNAQFGLSGSTATYLPGQGWLYSIQDFTIDVPALDVLTAITVNSLAVPHYVTATYTSADIDVQSSEPLTPAKGDIWFDTTVTGALLNIIEDTTPQLGGTLDANTFNIDMGTNILTDTNLGQFITAFGWGDWSGHNHSGVYELYDLAIVKSDETETIASIWNFTGIPTFNSLAVPHYVTATYTSADIDVQASEPVTPAKGDIWFDTTASGALLNIVEDTTPQLGATLQANTFNIDMGTNVITDTAVGQWITAFGWGNHAGTLYEPYDTAIVKSDETETVASVWNFTGIPTINSKGVAHYVTTGYTSGKITVAASAPGSPTKGDIWFDTT